MKKLLFILTIIFAYTEISFGEPVLRFAQIMDTSNQIIGAEILKTAYEKIGIPIEIVVMPGKRALKESSEGRVDGEVHRILKIGEIYPTLVRVTTPINFIEPSVFSRKHNFTITECSALKNFSIGIVRGVKHAEVCTEGMNNVTIFPHTANMLQLLNIERIDLAITGKINGIWLAKKHDLKEIYPLSPPLSQMLLYHYLHEKHKNLVPRINKIFDEMKNSGELEILRKKAIERLLEKVGK